MNSAMEQEMLTQITFSCTDDITMMCTMQRKFNYWLSWYLQLLTYDSIVLNFVFKQTSFFFKNYIDSFYVAFPMLSDIESQPSGESFPFGSQTLKFYKYSVDIFKKSHCFRVPRVNSYRQLQRLSLAEKIIPLESHTKTSSCMSEICSPVSTCSSFLR